MPDRDLEWTELPDLGAERNAQPFAAAWYDGMYVAAGMNVDVGGETGLGWSGALWTSDDALAWGRADELVDLAGTPITTLATRSDMLVGAGPAGFCFMHCDPGYLADQGTAIFIATAADEWRRTVRPPGLQHALIRHLVAIDTLIVGLGSIKNDGPRPSPGPYPDGTESIGMAWASRDAVTWTPATDLPRDHVFGPLVEHDGNFVTLVGDGFDEEIRVLWSDDGLHWGETHRSWEIEAIAASPNGFLAYVSDSEQVSWIGSRDGRDWMVVSAEAVDIPILHSLAWVGDRYLALGVEFGNDDDTDERSLGAWSSVDGRQWQREELPRDFPTGASISSLLPLENAAIVTMMDIGGPPPPPWLVRPSAR